MPNMPGMPCTSEDGHDAILVISSLIPGDDTPTQALCPICAPQYLVVLLAQLTSVDVSAFIEWSLTQPTEEEEDADAESESDAAPTDTADAETETNDEVVATSTPE